MIKRTDSSTGGNWSIIDNRRSTFNPVGKPLLADNTGARIWSFRYNYGFIIKMVLR